MSAYVKTLKDLNDDTIYPQTHTKAIYDEEGNRLDVTLGGINDDIEAIRNKFEVRINASDWIRTDSENAPTYDDYIYSCRVSVDGMHSDYNPKLFMNYISTDRAGKLAEERALALVKDILTYDGYVVAFAYQKPDVDIQINLSL